MTGAELLSRDAVRVNIGTEATIEGWGGPALNAPVRWIDKAGFEKVSVLGIEEQRVKIWLEQLFYFQVNPLERRLI